jgi:hypothetical protein
MADFRPALSAALRKAHDEGPAWFTWPGGTRMLLSPTWGPHAQLNQYRFVVLEQKWVIVVYHSHFVLGCHADKDGGYLNGCHWLEQAKLGKRAVDCIRFATDVRAVVLEAHGGELGDLITKHIAWREQWLKDLSARSSSDHSR